MSRKKSPVGNAALKAKVRPLQGDAGLALLRIRVELVYAQPAIWRTVEVPATMTLSDLHYVLQVLMGWEDCHMWAFETKKQRFAESDPDWELPGQAPVSPAEAVLGEVLTRKGARLGYNYDFGDDWWLAIISEGRAQAEPGMRYPRCVAGERAGPPEDCGGPPGFDGLLEARRNPKSRDARELLEWVGPDWNPDAFDVGQMNKALAALFAPRRKR